MIGVGTILTKPLLYGAAILVAFLGLVVLAQGAAIWWLRGELQGERDRYAALSEKNARCEAESARLQGSVDTQNKAVETLKGQCAAANATAQAAIKLSREQRPANAKLIADILAGKPSDPKDLCRSACVELRREIVR